MGFWDGNGISWTKCRQSEPRCRQITTPTRHHSDDESCVFWCRRCRQHGGDSGRVTCNRRSHRRHHSSYRSVYQCVTKQVGKFNNVVPPLFKKPTLDKEELSNYRPISNLSLISKIIESVVKSRITDHLTSNSLTQFSPVSILQTSFHRNSSFVHPRSPRQCSRITESIMPLLTRPLCCFRHYLP